MIGIDQKTASKIKTEALIQKSFGGRYSFWESIRSAGNGVGNIQYVSGLEKEGIVITNKFYKCNIEHLRSGIAIYVFNDEVNALFLLKDEEIISVDLTKMADIIDPAKHSYFRWMMKKGYNYYKCKFMLLEHEIIEDHKAILTFELKNNVKLKFSNRSYSPLKLSRFFQKEYWKGRYTENLQHSITLNNI